MFALLRSLSATLLEASRFGSWAAVTASARTIYEEALRPMRKRCDSSMAPHRRLVAARISAIDERTLVRMADGSCFQ
jgi:hypothetical protein